MAELRKAGETINDGERRVLQRLRDGLPTDWVILSNLYLRLSSATVLEIDAVVIGRDGLWALETKDWRGKIKGDALHWRLDDGCLRDNPLASIERKAKALHSFLVRVNPVYRNVSKVALVVIANNNARLKLPKEERQAVFLLDAVATALKSGEHIFGRLAVRLERDNIQQLADELFKAKAVPPPQRAGNYQLDEKLGDAAYADFRAHHIFLPNRTVRLKRFALTDELVPEAERKEQVRLFLRDMEALAVLENGRHPSLPVVYDFFADEDSDAVFWMAEEWEQGQTLRQALDTQAVPLPSHLGLIRQLAEVLAFCHRQGVIHRNLNPDNIMWLAGHTIKVLNFDYARIAGRVTISPRKRAQASPYLAPEQLEDPSAVDQRADLYALGVLWSEMLTGEPQRELRSRVRRNDTSDELFALVQRLLTPAPSKRLASAEELLSHLKRITTPG